VTLATSSFLEYSDAEHRYFADGKEIPSVTQILDASGMISQFCRDEEARDRGTRVHEFTATDDVKPVDLRTVPASLRGYLRAWRAYRRDSGFTPTLIEHRVDSAESGYSGRFDRIGFLPSYSMAVLMDLKTSKTGVIPEYARLQLSAYAHAFDPVRIFIRVAVSLRPDGRYNSKMYPTASHYIDRAEWLGLLHKYKENNGHSKGN
jgi:hypothetical protein